MIRWLARVFWAVLAINIALPVLLNHVNFGSMIGVYLLLCWLVLTTAAVAIGLPLIYRRRLRDWRAWLILPGIILAGGYGLSEALEGWGPGPWLVSGGMVEFGTLALMVDLLVKLINYDLGLPSCLASLGLFAWGLFVIVALAGGRLMDLSIPTPEAPDYFAMLRGWGALLTILVVWLLPISLLTYIGKTVGLIHRELRQVEPSSIGSNQE